MQVDAIVGEHQDCFSPMIESDRHGIVKRIVMVVSRLDGLLEEAQVLTEPAGQYEEETTLHARIAEMARGVIFIGQGG